MSLLIIGNPTNFGREHSLKQLVRRVTQTIADWGRREGYFADGASVTAFQDDLAWLLYHQHGAFNSPVWFNVGLGQAYGVRMRPDGKPLYGAVERMTSDAVKHGKGSGKAYPEIVIEEVDPYLHPQASACFIISVEDDLDDIWRLMGESARLFKYGSGVGADWSRLRSTKEKLSGGGTPSGPVSFMRVQDATGGTIRSG